MSLAILIAVIVLLIKFNGSINLATTAAEKKLAQTITELEVVNAEKTQEQAVRVEKLKKKHKHLKTPEEILTELWGTDVTA
jgi:hypothetical protein